MEEKEKINRVLPLDARINARRSVCFKNSLDMDITYAMGRLSGAV